MSEKTVRRRLEAGLLPAIQSGGPGTMWRIDAEAYALQTVQAAAPSRVNLAAGIALPSCKAGAPIPGPHPRWKKRMPDST